MSENASSQNIYVITRRDYVVRQDDETDASDLSNDVSGLPFSLVARADVDSRRLADVRCLLCPPT